MEGAQRWHWFWVFDRSFVGLVGGFMLVSSLVTAIILSAMSGRLSLVEDPEKALLKRDAAVEPRDVSWGLELRAIDGNPIGVEFRKVGKDEQLVIFQRGNLVVDR